MFLLNTKLVTFCFSQ